MIHEDAEEEYTNADSTDTTNTSSYSAEEATIDRTVEVRDPIKVTGVAPYVSYKVVSRMHFKGNERIVERRYSDFAWLSDALRESHSDCIIPPLPPKLTIGRFEESFIEVRRRGLDKFVNRISQHPQLSKSGHFKTFLVGTEFDLSVSKGKHGQRSVSEGVAASSWFMQSLGGMVRNSARSLMEGVVGADGRKSFGGGVGAGKDQQLPELAVKRTGEGVVRSKLRFSKNVDMYDQTLDDAALTSRIMSDMSGKVSAVVIKTVDVSSAQSRLGQALSAYGQQEEEDNELRALCMDLGNALGSASLALGTLAQADYQSFEEPLLEQVGMAESIRAAFQTRRNLKLSYIAECGVVSQRRDRLEYEIAAYNAAEKSDSSMQKRLEAEQAFIEEETTGLLRKKQGLLEVSERLMNDYERVRYVSGLELQEALVSFTYRRVIRIILLD